jgi:SlyX protein
MSEQRFIDIETKLLHQEMLNEDLHKALLEQQEKIRSLETTLAALVKRFRDGATADRELGPHNEKPPHY